MMKFDKTLPVGLQLYTVRDYLAADLIGTLKKVKAMGYDYVEPAGLYDYTAEEFRKALDDIGLTAICAHVPYAAMKADIDKVIADYKTIGINYIAIPYLEPDDRPDGKNYDEFLKNAYAFGKKFAENGMTMLYHNHDFEFTKLPDGRYALDAMYEGIPAEYLQTELDCCWVKVGGENPAAYIRKYAGRAPIVHLKDFAGSKAENMYNLIGLAATEKVTNTFQLRPVGYGRQDIPTILEAALESGTKYLVVEQDNWGDQTALEAAEMSRNYLRTLGF
jgi:sugar phosphate isomerase/epimerase